MKWNVCKIENDNFISDSRLKNFYGIIIITYETVKGKRYAKSVLCNYGYISKRITGNIIAWMKLPQPYKG